MMFRCVGIAAVMCALVFGTHIANCHNTNQRRLFGTRFASDEPKEVSANDSSKEAPRITRCMYSNTRRGQTWHRTSELGVSVDNGFSGLGIWTSADNSKSAYVIETTKSCEDLTDICLSEPLSTDAWVLYWRYMSANELRPGTVGNYLPSADGNFGVSDTGAAVYFRDNKKGMAAQFAIVDQGFDCSTDLWTLGMSVNLCMAGWNDDQWTTATRTTAIMYKHLKYRAIPGVESDNWADGIGEYRHVFRDNNWYYYWNTIAAMADDDVFELLEIPANEQCSQLKQKPRKPEEWHS